MAKRAWQAADIKGLVPGIDPRNSEETFVVGGRNFAFTSKGPASVFGNRFLTTEPLASPEHCQAIRVRLRSGTRVFTFPGDGIYEWNEEAGELTLLYETAPTNVSPYRWTHGYLNGKIYFCHPVTGIIVYDLDTNTLFAHDGPGVPTNPLAIAINSGRLIVLDVNHLSWSWQSDGMNFTPALGQAGQQLVSDRVAGFPIMLSNYAEGIITWTTGGMMQSQFTGDQEVYRHRNLNTEFHPANSFCALQLDDNTCVILDERGLFSSKGGAPTPYAPLFNEFLIEYIRLNDLAIGDNLRLEWDDLRRFMYVSVSVTPEYPRYEKSFVLYPPLDKWGSFNEIHHGIMPIHIGANERGGQYFGFVDVEGRVKYWDNLPTREEIGEGGSTEFVGLDAKIQLGLIHFPELGDSLDRMAEVNNIGLGSLVSGPENQFPEDYLLVPDGVSDEDYEQVEGAEDFGFGTLHYVNHKVRVIGTLDGKSAFHVEEAMLAGFEEGIRHYSCSVPGVWHIIELSAEDPGEAFRLQLMQINAVDGGSVL
jgi:hypothetical protein